MDACMSVFVTPLLTMLSNEMNFLDAELKQPNVWRGLFY